eukprot:TRINITY_DN4454_c0_g1_i1.p1 TRINITY_DN4454_c0_g1~~TRINITY_DN4454_c0_g1_i1.p1  ORF type:complete len:114 (+),score=11.22 TRINITY_DN4454_c0_g1_i1:148-489(+)
MDEEPVPTCLMSENAKIKIGLTPSPCFKGNCGSSYGLFSKLDRKRPRGDKDIHTTQFRYVNLKRHREKNSDQSIEPGRFNKRKPETFGLEAHGLILGSSAFISIRTSQFIVEE